MSILTLPLESLGMQYLCDSSFTAIIDCCSKEEKTAVANKVGEFILSQNIDIAKEDTAALIMKLFESILSQSDIRSYSLLSRILHHVHLETPSLQKKVSEKWTVHCSTCLSGFRSSLRTPL